MKKITVILAGLAIVAASCTKTEVVGDKTQDSVRGIGFSAYTSRPTKTAQVDVKTDNLNSFKVSAIGNDAVYFHNVTFTKGTVWTSNPVYFWPAYALNFYAYNTPEKADCTFNPTINTTDPQTLYVKPAADLANQEDLVAAYAESKKEENTTGTEKALPITFKHYLTQVIVNALSTNSNYQVEVKGVKLANLAGDGTYTFSTNKMVATEANVNSDTSADYDEEFSAKTLTTTAKEMMKDDADGGKWYLIPQTVNAWDQVNDKKNGSHGTYLALKVKITANGGTLKIYPASGDDAAWMAVPVPASLEFKQGVKYNVIVKFFGEDGTGGAGYVDPEKPGDLDGNSTADENEKGQAILGGAIKFSATVDAWGDTVNVTILL